MKLFYSPTSPFARKVRVVMAERQLGEIELVTVSPFDLPPQLLAANPLSKVPALLLSDGSVLYDSPVICEYLDGLGLAPALIPPAGPARWTVQRRHALADGLMDTTLSLAIEENRRPENERSPQWINRWGATIRRTVDALEQECNWSGDPVDMGQIAIACALAYLDLRAAAHVTWRAGAPQLSEWFAAFARRPSMQTTIPA